MEINNLLYNYIKKDIPKEILNRNSIFEGKILDVLDDIIIINIPGKGIVHANSNINMDNYIGEEIKFLVLSKTDSIIEIKPIIKETLRENSELAESSISKILKEFGVEDIPVNRELINKLMENNIPLKKTIVNDVIKTFDKLTQLIDLEDSESIEIINKDIGEVKYKDIDSQQEVIKSIENLYWNDDIDDIIEVEKNLIESGDDLEPNKDEKTNNFKEGNKNLLSKLETIELLNEIRKMEEILELDIKNIVVSEEEGANIKNEEKDLILEMLNPFKVKKSEKDILDIITFITKNEMTPNINNISNLKQLIDDPFSFMKDLTNLRNVFLEDPRLMNLLLEVVDKEEIINDEKSINSIFEKEDIENLEKILSNNSISKENILDIKEKTQFFKDLNNEMYYHMIPITYGDDKLEGFINMIKEKRSNNEKDIIKIFINLKTNFLGNIKAVTKVKSNMLYIKIGINKEDKYLFYEGKEVLLDRIQKYGYKVKDIEFVIEKDIKLLDVFDGKDKRNSIHFLDIKV